MLIHEHQRAVVWIFSAQLVGLPLALSLAFWTVWSGFHACDCQLNMVCSAKFKQFSPRRICPEGDHCRRTWDPTGT
ncbi:hypothetical protein K438DRAFT_589468 [Mycena galopus ATCC 62051]|nr:hypothetical protein K438DRAFT_589468 [Mycena galopus ATCC 62051]